MVCYLEVASHFRIKLRSTCNMGTHTRGVRKGFSSDITCLYPKGFFWKFAKEGLIYVLGSPLSGNLLSVCCFQNNFFHSFHLYSTLETTSNEFELVQHISIQDLLY